MDYVHDYGHSEDSEGFGDSKQNLFAKPSQIVVEPTAFGLRSRDCWLNSASRPRVSRIFKNILQREVF